MLSRQFEVAIDQFDGILHTVSILYISGSRTILNATKPTDVYTTCTSIQSVIPDDQKKLPTQRCSPGQHLTAATQALNTN